MRKITLLMAVLGLMFTTTAQDLPDYIPTNGLVGYWGFDGDANDYSGNGLHLFEHDGAFLVKDRFGENSSAYGFTTIADGSQLLFDESAFSSVNNLDSGTISMWIKINEHTISGHYFGFDNTFFVKQTDGITTELFLGLSGGSTKLRVHLSGPLPSSSVFESNRELNIGQWYNIVFTWGEGIHKIYIDGYLDNEQSSAVTLSDNKNPSFMGVGSFNGQGSIASNSHIDDIGVWSRALSEEEIQSIYTDDRVSDIDGNLYSSVVIGEQEWMSENLRVSKYNDGTPIPQVTNQNEWKNLNSSAYCWYDNDSANYDILYGKLYNFYAVEDNRNICPIGWHVPSDNEWIELTNYLQNNGHDGFEGKALKSSVGWNDNGNGTNNFGFNGLPSGYRNDWTFDNVGNFTYWWSSTKANLSDAVNYELKSNSDEIIRNEYYVRHGFPVRCIKDRECDTTYNTTLDTSSCNIYISEGGKQLTESGVLIDSFITGNGCDSIVTINVSLYISKFINDTTVFIVSSNNYEGHSLVVDSIGIDSLIQQQNHCDSFVTRFEMYKYEENFYNDTIDVLDTTEVMDTTFTEVFDTTEVMDTTVTEFFDTSIIQLYHVDTIITEIFDTSEVLLSDTNIITLYSIDTLIVEVFDTLSAYDTILVVEGDTQVVTLHNIDTLTTEVFDTVSVTETVTYTIFDTISVMDTTTTVLYQIDTQVVTINDTNEVMIDVYDTTYVSVEDTLVITMSSDTAAGIDFLTTQVNVYPNPASTQLNVEIDMSGDYTVSLTNISGQMVFTQANVMSNIQIDISEFTQGLYFITITDNDGVLKAEERKIVIE